MKKLSVLYILISSAFLVSCGYMARQVLTPNTCKKCDIIDQFGEVVWSEDDCGGGVYNMEQRAKATAYDYGCGNTVNCYSYKSETESED